jgi:hypothetical protein
MINLLVGGKTGGVLFDVQKERERHASLIASGKFIDYFIAGIPEEQRLAILAEEFGEASREVMEIVLEYRRTYTEGQRTVDDMLAGKKEGSGTEAIREENITARRAKLRKELVQCAAVCVAWCEALDAEEEARQK